ncbi:unnamed protein product, partial [Urochloa humidicola]
RCQEGMLNTAVEVADRACRMLVNDMWHETRICAIVQYWAGKGRRVTKKEARRLKMTRQQFLSVPPWFLANNTQCWAMVVDKWFSEGWVAKHKDGQQRRALMPGVPHHQGSRNIKQFSKKW